MNLKNEVTSYKETRRKADALREHIKKVLKKDIINRGYKWQRINVGYNNPGCDDKEIICYYPVLSLKKGYKKAEETYIKQFFDNSILYKYILIDSNNTKIYVTEYATYKGISINEGEMWVKKDAKYISYIRYSLRIDGEEFSFESQFSIINLIKEIWGNLIVKYDEAINDYLEYHHITINNEKEAEKYRKFISDFDITLNKENAFEKICDSSDDEELVGNDIKIRIRKNIKTEMMNDLGNVEEIYIKIWFPITVISLNISAYDTIAGKEYEISSTKLSYVKVDDEYFGKEVPILELINIDE